MDIVDLRRRQAEIESRIYRTQDRLRAELSRLRGRVDTRRQNVRDVRRTGLQVLTGAGIGIVLSLVTTVFRNAFRARRLEKRERTTFRDLRHELEDREGYGHGEHRGWLGRRARSEERHQARHRIDERHRFDRDARVGREDHYLGGHREPIPQGYGRRLHSDEDHDWADFPPRR